MSVFRFTLDPSGVPLVLAVDPIGWDKGEITIKRDPIIKGLFTQFTSKLTFVETGYTRIFDDSETTICEELAVRIEERCHPNEEFTTLFNGIINLSEVEFNVTRCQAKCVIEDASLTALIMRNMDLKVPMDNGSSLDGTPLADIGIDTDYFHEITRAYIFLDRKTFTLRGAYQYILDYITNSQITFSSDFFEVETFSIEQYTLVFDAPFNGNLNTVTVEFTNNWNQDISIATLATGAGQGLRLAAVAKGLIVNVTTGNPMVMMLEWDQQVFAFSVTDEVDTITLDTWLPFTDVTCVVTGAGAPGCTVTKITSMSYGMKNCVVCNGDSLADINPPQEVEQFISLRELVINCFQSFGTTFSIFTNSGGTNIFKVEREEDFFDVASSAVLQNVNNVDYKFSKDFVQRSIAVGNEPTQPELYRPWEGAQWDLANCIGEELNLVNTFVIDTKIVFFTTSGARDFNANIDTLFFTQVESAGAGAAAGFNFAWVNTGTRLHYLQYNAAMIDGNKLFYHFFGITGDMTSFNKDLGFTELEKVLTNTSTTNIVKLYEFEAPLTLTQFIEVRGDPEKSIIFDIGDGINVVSWIKELKYNIITGLTKFKLYTE